MKRRILYILSMSFFVALMTGQNVSTFLGGTLDDAIALDSGGTINASNFTGDSVFKFDTNGNADAFISAPKPSINMILMVINWQQFLLARALQES